MYDRFNRRINYLRISVTDRCNLRCRYCMPETGVKLLDHSDILSFEEIVEAVRVCVSMGINKIRITGGEPLVRKHIVNLVRMIAVVPGVSDLSMTTNGMLLEEYAIPLADAGLDRINISLDTINPAKFLEITGTNGLEKIFKGIEAAKKAGLYPIKINCVLLRNENLNDAEQVKAYARKNGFEVRFIHQMDLRNGEFSVVEGGDGGNCSVCNRIRLTANGLIKPCLFSDLGFDIRELGIEKAIRLAVLEKPEAGTRNKSGRFYEIGG
jgi:cyclic pyranopterin phosphate synthase